MSEPVLTSAIPTRRYIQPGNGYRRRQGTNVIMLCLAGVMTL